MPLYGSAIPDWNRGVSKLGFFGSHTDNYSFLTETPDRVNPRRLSTFRSASLHSQSPHKSPDPEEDYNHLSEASYESMKRSDLPKNGDSFPYTSLRE